MKFSLALAGFGLYIVALVCLAKANMTFPVYILVAGNVIVTAIQISITIIDLETIKKLKNIRNLINNNIIRNAIVNNKNIISLHIANINKSKLLLKSNDYSLLVYYLFLAEICLTLSLYSVDLSFLSFGTIYLTSVGMKYISLKLLNESSENHLKELKCLLNTNNN